MSYPDEQPTSDQQPNPYWPPQPPAAPTEKSRLPWLVAAAVAVLLIVGVIVGIVVNSAGGAGSTATKTASAWDQEQARKSQPEPDPVVDTPAPGPTPDASDIKLTAKITSKHCFGSAGCNLEFKVNLAYSGPSLSDADTWEVTYEVTGVEDGPMVDTLELTGTTFTATEQSASTTSSKKKISIKVTGVDKVGI